MEINMKSSYVGIVAWNMTASRNPPQRKERRVKCGLTRPRFIFEGDYTGEFTMFVPIIVNTYSIIVLYQGIGSNLYPTP